MAGTHETLRDILRATEPIQWPEVVWVVAAPGGFREATFDIRNARIIAGHIEGAQIASYRLERVQ